MPEAMTQMVNAASSKRRVTRARDDCSDEDRGAADRREAETPPQRARDLVVEKTQKYRGGELQATASPRRG